MHEFRYLKIDIMNIIFRKILFFTFSKKENQSDVYLKQIINDQLGGWPLLSNKDNAYSALEVMKRINKFKYLTIMPIYVGANPKNTKVNLIKVNIFL